MKIGIVSDLHANLPGLEAVTRALEGEGVDTVLVAGDFVGYYLDVNEVIDLVRLRGWMAIRGNHDEYLLGSGQDDTHNELYRISQSSRVIRDDNLGWLAELPPLRRLELCGRSLLLSHGSPWRVDEYVYPDRADWSLFDSLDVDVVIMGHTHHPFVRRAAHALLINPGSCGQPRDGDPRASFAVLDLQSMTTLLRRANYDVETLQKRLRRAGVDERAAAMLSRSGAT